MWASCAVYPAMKSGCNENLQKIRAFRRQMVAAGTGRSRPSLMNFARAKVRFWLLTTTSSRQAMNGHHSKTSFQSSLPKELCYFSTGSTPKPIFDPTSSSRDDVSEKQESKLTRALLRVPCGYQLDLIVRNDSALPVEIQSLVQEQGQYYHLTQVDLSHLLQPHFMNDYIRKGSLIALSVDDSEGQDIVAIDGRGRMILSVGKDTYETLGLPGRKSRNGSYGQKFIIELPLSSDAYRSGKPGFEKVKKLLSDWPEESDLFDQLSGTSRSKEVGPKGGKKWDLLMTFVDENGHFAPIIFPSTISARLCQPKLDTNYSSIPIPSIPVLSPPPPLDKRRKLMNPHGIRIKSSTLPTDWEEQLSKLESLREWNGLLRYGVPQTTLLEGLEPEDFEIEKGNLQVMNFKGFFHPSLADKIVRFLIKNFERVEKGHTSLNLIAPKHHPFTHLSSKAEPVVGTNKRLTKSGLKKRVKRGRGRGEEEESTNPLVDGDSGTDGAGVEIWLSSMKKGVEEEGDRVNWLMWEWQ